MRQGLLLMLFLLVLFPARGESEYSVGGRRYPQDLAAARDLCDTLPLSGPEGIWRFEADKVTVLILKNPEKKGFWDIAVVESDDRALHEGDIIGWLQESTNPDKFTMHLFTSRKRGRLCKPGSCLVTYSQKNESLTVEAGKVKFSFNPLGLLSQFRRGLSIRYDNPLEKLPSGMIKLYPGYDGNGSSRRKIRYL